MNDGAVYDFDAIRARVEELRKATGPKPRCMWHEEGKCMKPCSEQSDCYLEAQREKTRAQLSVG